MTNEIINFFIIIVPIIILLLFLFTKTIFKVLDNRVLNKYYGQLGLFNSLVFAILFSNNMSEIAMKKFLYFVIIFVFSVIFIIVMEIIYRKFNFDIKPQIVKPAFIAPFSAFGVFVGDFFKEKDVEILIKYAPLLFGAVFLMFYPYLIKYKNQSGEDQSGDQSDQSGTNQTNY